VPIPETVISHDPHTVRVGSPGHDAQHDPAKTCSVCGGERDLTHVFRSATTAHVCLGCIERAVKRLDPNGLPGLQIRRCVACPVNDPARFATTLVFPLRSYGPPPYWPVCAKHLNAALDELAGDRVSS